MELAKFADGIVLHQRMGLGNYGSESDRGCGDGHDCDDGRGRGDGRGNVRVQNRY